MATFKKYWFPIVLFILLFSRFIFFSDPEGFVHKRETHGFMVPDKNTVDEKSIFTKDDTLKFAEKASKETGIRSEYLFAIFSQESSMGKNVGSCFLFDPDLFGGGVGVDFRSGIFTSRIMKPERDIQPFLSIMKELGRNPYFTPISCPMKIGWGGAMGPAQILPSTWLSVKDRTAIVLGKRIANPWAPEDAFMAAAIHLKDLGADHRNFSSERTAACRYFSGKDCGETKIVTIKKKHGKTRQKLVYVENRMIAAYGNSIMKKTAYFQKILKPKEVVQKKHGVKPKQKSLQPKDQKQQEKHVSKKQHQETNTSAQQKSNPEKNEK